MWWLRRTYIHTYIYLTCTCTYIPEGCLYLAASLAITPLDDSSPSDVHVCDSGAWMDWVVGGMWDSSWWSIDPDQGTQWSIQSSSNPIINRRRPPVNPGRPRIYGTPPTNASQCTHHAIGRRELDLELPLVAEVVVKQVCGWWEWVGWSGKR